MKFKKNLKRLKGDASLRVFFRNKKKPSSIIVLAKKEKKTNLLIYDAINKIFIMNDILAPKLLSENFSKNYIEIEDFGNQTVYKLFKENRINKLATFQKIIKLLNKIQLIRQREIKNFKKRKYIIPNYKPRILLEEAKLFSDWYVAKKLPKSKLPKFKKKFIKVINNLIKKLYLKNNIFVHRDFHVSNLMIVKNEIGIIDSQDALIGNKAYDLASLIDDVRHQTSKNFKNKLFNFYLKSQKKLNRKHFRNDFEIISVLRNLKIIGIFTRLAVRDNKKKYLKLISNAWNLIKLRSKNNHKFKDLNDLLKILKKNYT